MSCDRSRRRPGTPRTRPRSRGHRQVRRRTLVEMFGCDRASLSFCARATFYPWPRSTGTAYASTPQRRSTRTGRSSRASRRARTLRSRASAGGPLRRKRPRGTRRVWDANGEDRGRVPGPVRVGALHCERERPVPHEQRARDDHRDERDRAAAVPMRHQVQRRRRPSRTRRARRARPTPDEHLFVHNMIKNCEAAIEAI